MLPLIALAAVSTGNACNASGCTLQNEHLRLHVGRDAADNLIIDFLGHSAAGSANLLATQGYSHASPAMWEAQLTTPAGIVQRSSYNATGTKSQATIKGSTLTLEWSLSERVDQRDVPYTVAITLFLPAGARTAEIRASVAKPDPFNEARLGLWAITLTVGMIAASADDEVFTPTGLGVSLRGAVEGQKYLGRYPGSSSTLQFLAVGGGTTSDGCGVYFGAHDPHARAKWLSWTVTNSTGDAAGVVAAAEVADESAECLQRGICGGTAATSNLHGGATRVRTSTDGFGCSGHRCSCPLMSPAAFSPAKARGPARFHTLGMSYVVEGAGGPFSTYKLPFPLALGVTPSHAGPLWYTAAQLYREWAVEARGAAWIAAAPAGIAERPHSFPPWLLETNVWVNSGWQCYDRFNLTQGDPSVVVERASSAAALFGLGPGSEAGPLSLHWYEWQCGLAGLCKNATDPQRFQFDTMYPDYEPPRGGGAPAMRAATEALRRANVRSVPYVNGRIFDMDSASFRQHDKGASCVRLPKDGEVVFNATGGDLCTEYYGSKELDGSKAIFAVADPSTTYWQQKYASLIGRLMDHTNGSGVDGVYIDQLGAASPVLDWSPGRNHAIGGGRWWRDGLVGLVEASRRTAGGTAALVTESNSEAVIDAASGLLTLAAFAAAPLVQAPSAAGARFMNPAFAAIYGGYYVGFGAIYAGADFAPNPDVLAARLATQFVYGSQLGWFSLGGVTHGDRLDHQCGPMGTAALWADPKHAAELSFLKGLVRMRARLGRYLTYGRLVQPVVVSPAPATFVSPPSATPPSNPGPFPVLSHAVWRTNGTSMGAPASVAVLLVASTHADVTVSFNLFVASYFGPSTKESVALDVLGDDGSRERIGTYSGGSVPVVARVIKGRSVQVLELTPIPSIGSHQV